MPRKENKSVIKKAGDKTIIYCHEPYAQELYDFMANCKTNKKDIQDGDLLRVLDMKLINDNEVEVTCENYDTLYFNLKKERKYVHILDFDDESFKSWIQSGDCKIHFEFNNVYILVENKEFSKGTLYGAHLKTIADEFKSQITKPTSAYKAKILSKNQGGFLVEVQGIKAFLPGSLAAANKIVNFDEYIGKDVTVMIEDYLATSDIFVVSYKKYLDNILPSKLDKLEKNTIVTGSITGTSKFGIFVEVDELFTGLLHSSEMNPETVEKFNLGYYKIGSTITTWLKDVKDGKLILTEFDPAIKQGEMEIVKNNIEGKYKDGIIVSIKAHGALIELEKGMIGLLPVKEMKKAGKRLNVGDSIEIFIKKVDSVSSKIYITMYEEQGIES